MVLAALGLERVERRARVGGQRPGAQDAYSLLRGGGRPARAWPVWKGQESDVPEAGGAAGCVARVLLRG